MPKLQLPFMQVDVFSTQTDPILSGNPLAVFYDVSPFLDGSTMQAIAREMNCPETTFVTENPQDGEEYHVRIFTPYKELPFAGHPTLGTYFVLREKGLLSGPGVQTSEAGGTLCSQDDQGWVWIVPPQGHVRDVLVSATRLASAFGVGDIYLNDMMPPAVCGTGLDQLVVLSSNAEILSDLQPLPSRLTSLQKDMVVEGIYVVAMVGPTTYQARYFSQEGEDPATGSAAAGLGTYLMHSAGETAIRRYIISQGTEVGRSSEIHLRLNDLSQGSLELGGRVLPVIDGLFYV